MIILGFVPALGLRLSTCSVILFIYVLPWQGGKLCKGTQNPVCQLPWSPGRGAGQRGRPSLTADRLGGCNGGQRALFGLQRASHTPWLSLTGLISQAERSSCFPSSHLCARSCSQFLVSLHGDPQGYVPSRAPRMQGIGAPILAKISKEELLGRLSPAQRREGEIGHPDLGKHRNQASSGFWGTELIHLFT